ncbi:MAG: YraN family protein [Stagnimonas sp.]|nr:YraN family protein [Stagnimonas sp.]
MNSTLGALGVLRALRAATTGADAEQRACTELQRRGLKLVARNWRCRHGELDLLMLDGDTLAVIEVRARAHASYGGAAGSVDGRKQRRIAAATQAWLQQNPRWAESPLRFDVYACEADGHSDWLQAAFTLDDL